MYEKSCVKYLKKLDRNTQIRIIKAINQLPFGDIKKLQGNSEDYRLRVGHYRVIFSHNILNHDLKYIQSALDLSGYLERPLLTNVIEKNNSMQSKDLASNEKDKIAGSIVKRRTFKKQVSILLIDDLYQTGSTLNEIARILKSDPNVQNILF